MRPSLASTLPFCAIPVVLFGCSRAGAPVVTAPTAAQLAEFAQNARITLPVSAQPVGYREERGMDDALWLQIRMPAPDLQSFLDSSPFCGATLTTSDQYLVSQFQEFFTTPPTRYRAGQQELPNARVLNMVIDESDTTNVIVYLMWHEM
jgi:hypothetical protein